MWHTKVIKLLSELDTVKGVGLIERKKQGQGKPTIIYVKSFSSLGAEKPIPKNEDRKTYAKPNFKTSVNEKSETDLTGTGIENPVNNLENATPTVSVDDKNFENDGVSFSHISDTEVLTSQKRKSAPLENGSLDFSNADTNKTYVNNTKFNDTKSINPSTPFSQNEKRKRTRNDGLMDRVNLEQLENIVYEELFDNETLPYEYVVDESKMTIAIHILTEYETHKGNNTLASSSFEFSVFKLFNEALIEMLTTQKPMTLKGSHVTYAKVYDKLMPYVHFEGGHCNIYDLQETAIQDFTQACKEQEIKNHLAYMKSVIWNAMQVGDIGIQALIKKDFG